MIATLDNIINDNIIIETSVMHNIITNIPIGDGIIDTYIIPRSLQSLVKLSHGKFTNDKIKGIDYVECALCKYRGQDITQHIKRIHISDISIDNYKKSYGEIKSQSLIDRIKSGAMSPFSKGFNKYKDLENGADLAKTKMKSAYANSLAKPENRSTTMEYWRAKGFSDEESKKKIFDRQQTFTLEKCIKQHGTDKGQRIWQERQTKWLETLNNKSDEEKIAINKRKIPFLNFRTLWTGAAANDKIGIFYIILLDNGNIKLGITIKPNLISRYNKIYKNINSILIEYKMPIKRAFVIEQIMKRELQEYSISKEEQLLDFGYTETFKTESYKICDLFKNINEDMDLHGRFIKHYPKAIRHNFEEVCRSI